MIGRLFRRPVVYGSIFVAVLGIGAWFRFQGLSGFSQVGGDDVAYRVEIPQYFDWAWDSLWERGIPGRGFLAPLVAAVRMSHIGLDQTETTWAKPLFVLNLAIAEEVAGLTVQVLHEWTALLGLAVLLLAGAIGRRLWGFDAGALAAFLLAVSPWAVRYSTWGLHVTGGSVLILAALYFAVRADLTGKLSSSFGYGLSLWAAVYYSTSSIFPAFLLIVFELARLAAKGSRDGKGCLWFLAGLLGGAAAWEAVNFAVCSLWIGYTPFPLKLWAGIRHNAANALPLPTDPWFFWRHLVISEGWGLTGLLAAGAVAGTIAAVRRNCGRRLSLLRLIFLFWGIAQGMDAFGGTQVIRHYFPGFLAGVIVTGWWLSGWRRFRRWCGWVLAVVLLAVAVRQYREVRVYRESRSAPARLAEWELDTGRKGEGASMAMQQWDLWPSLTMFKDGEELEAFVRGHPRGHIMYSDYIGIAHGAWFYHNRQELLLAETLRACRRPLFAAPSYLSYPPMLFENEYYYWGLLRGKPERFDSAVRVFSVAEVLRVRDEVRRDVSRRRSLQARLRRPPPLIIPAWKHRVVLPYLDPESIPRPASGVRLGEVLVPLGLLAAGLFRMRGRSRGPRAFSRGRVSEPGVNGGKAGT